MVILFDLSGVVFCDGRDSYIPLIAKKYNLKPEDIKYVLDGDFSEKYRKGIIPDEVFWQEAKKYFKVSDEQICDIKKIFFNSYVPYQESINFIKNLKKKGHTVSFLSDSPKDRTEYLQQKYHFINLFHFGQFSFQSHVRKPEPEAYNLFLKNFKIKSRQVLYIDDRETGIKPAAKLGMKTILFKNFKQTQKQIKEFLKQDTVCGKSKLKVRLSSN